jgi:hypothetical protein
MGQLERALRPTTLHPAFAWDDPYLLDQQLTEDEGTHDVHALILGRATTGIQAFT